MPDLSPRDAIARLHVAAHLRGCPDTIWRAATLEQQQAALAYADRILRPSVCDVGRGALTLAAMVIGATLGNAALVVANLRARAGGER